MYANAETPSRKATDNDKGLFCFDLNIRVLDVVIDNFFINKQPNDHDEHLTNGIPTEHFLIHLSFQQYVSCSYVADEILESMIIFVVWIKN